LLQASFKPPKSIREGIPICFPHVCVYFFWVSMFLCHLVSLFFEVLLIYLQISNHGSLEHHGFARNKFWTLDPNPPAFPTNSTNKAFTDLILKHSEDDTKNWPHRYIS